MGIVIDHLDGRQWTRERLDGVVGEHGIECSAGLVSSSFGGPIDRLAAPSSVLCSLIQWGRESLRSWRW